MTTLDSQTPAFSAETESSGHRFVYRSDEAGFDELVNTINVDADDKSHPLSMKSAAILQMELGHQLVDREPDQGPSESK